MAMKNLINVVFKLLNKDMEDKKSFNDQYFNKRDDFNGRQKVGFYRNNH